MQNQITTDANNRKKPFLFFLLVLLLILVGALRSRIATRLDSFTYDEAYHIGAGAAYVKTGDFRLNPEHPPLVKLWAGAFVVVQGFHLSPYRSFLDKGDERAFVQEDVYVKNNPDAVQRRTRTAMIILNGLLLLLTAFAVRRIFGDLMAICCAGFLLIDPTIAAHFPVVMTDLPLALLSISSVMFAIAAFRSWLFKDLLLAGITLGLALSAKHSAIVTEIAVLLTGVVFAILNRDKNKAWRQAGSIAFVAIVSLFVLWGSYFFRWNESSGKVEETFNRTLNEKISDVRSTSSRTVLTTIAKAKLLPRAYIWGLADTIRAGAEGRAISILAFGNLYYSRAPAYYFPGIIGVKVPLGLLLLTLAGFVLLLSGRVPLVWRAPLFAAVGFAILFLIALMQGSSYAGVRHALPVFPPIALLGATAMVYGWDSQSRSLRGVMSVALLLALVSAIPAKRPWEYFNEFAGGTQNAHRYFNDEGVDLGLRTKEMAAYYHHNLKPKGIIPFIVYFSPKIEWKRRGVDWVGNNRERDAGKIFEETVSGTFVFGANQLAPALWWDVGKTFRETRPVHRFGNVFVFQGAFPRPKAAAAYTLYYAAVHGKIYVSEPDVIGAIELLKQSIDLDPNAFFVALELGNQYLKLGKRQESVEAYRLAARQTPPDAEEIRKQLNDQIHVVESLPLDEVPPLRNPGLE